VSDVLTVFAAAGWKTEIAIKEYRRHAIHLAAKGAKELYELIISYGGDGTLGQVLNRVLATKRHRSVVELTPGGTANLWASEMDVAREPRPLALAPERCR
jgi:diacylglycerol kinase family enzyme